VFPDDHCFALIGYSDGGDIVWRKLSPCYGLFRDAYGCFSDFYRVMFNPARLRKMLR
jgi:hypothetical protein